MSSLLVLGLTSFLNYTVGNKVPVFMVAQGKLSQWLACSVLYYLSGPWCGLFSQYEFPSLLVYYSVWDSGLALQAWTVIPTTWRYFLSLQFFCFAVIGLDCWWFYALFLNPQTCLTGMVLCTLQPVNIHPCLGGEKRTVLPLICPSVICPSAGFECIPWLLILIFLLDVIRGLCGLVLTHFMVVCRPSAPHLCVWIGIEATTFLPVNCNELSVYA